MITKLPYRPPQEFSELQLAEVVGILREDSGEGERSFEEKANGIWGRRQTVFVAQPVLAREVFAAQEKPVGKERHVRPVSTPSGERDFALASHVRLRSETRSRRSTTVKQTSG